MQLIALCEKKKNLSFIVTERSRGKYNFASIIGFAFILVASLMFHFDAICF